MKLRNVKTGEVRKADLNRDERPVVKISGRKVTLRWDFMAEHWEGWAHGEGEAYPVFFREVK